MLAEWTKLRTVPSTMWLVLGTIAASIALGAALVASFSADRCQQVGCVADLTKLSLTGVRLGQVPLAVLAVLAIAGEYSTGTIHVSLTGVPRRGILMASKFAVVAGMAMAAGASSVLGSWLVASVILTPTRVGRYALPSLADGDSARAAVGTVLYLGLIAVLSMGIATIVRDTAGAITAVLALLFLSPMLVMIVSNPHWQHRIEKYAPMSAGLAVQATKGISSQPIGPWAGLTVCAVYAAGAALAGAVLFRYRDA